MNKIVVVNIIRFILLLVAQILLFNNINFMGFVSPFPYILFIILYPVNGNKSLLLVCSFLLGLLIDTFVDSGGIHAAACVLLAYFRPVFFRFSFGLSYEYQVIRLNDTLTLERFSFLLTFILFHNLLLFVLEAFQISFIWDVLIRTLLSSLFSIIICIIIIQIIKPNK
jgi:rod shape-determining protein MreD